MRSLTEESRMELTAMPAGPGGGQAILRIWVKRPDRHHFYGQSRELSPGEAFHVAKRVKEFRMEQVHKGKPFPPRYAEEAMGLLEKFRLEACTARGRIQHANPGGKDRQ